MGTAMSVIEALAAELAPRVAALLGRAILPETYSSRALPARCSRRRFAEVCRSGRVEGAYRDGRDWVCSRAAWEAARAGRPTASRTPSLDARADALLARSGLRVVGGRR
jgi:hypothetical protein